jgi:LysR family transcriptional regulator, glycine cleavage system transcriptional activator
MQGFRTRLPPANSLIAFEAAARHASFTRAAAEFGVTQAAISRQILIIENHLGVALFQRMHRAIALTPAGEQLFQAVTIGLGHIASTVDDLRRERDSADVTVSCSVTFASYWLMARIAKFRAQYPDVDIRLMASAKVRDLATTGIDLGIRYGRGSWPGVTAQHLFGNEIFPVCAPAYLDRGHGIAKISDLQDATLLHLTQFDRNWTTWETWFEEFGMTPPTLARGLSFDNYMILLHAAVRGEGVALCGGRLAEDLIARGELVRPINAALRSEFSFYLISPGERPLRPDAALFRDWLVDEARGPGDSGAGISQA